MSTKHWHPDEHRTDMFEVDDREDNSIDFADFLLSHAIEHECNYQVSCSGNHNDGLREIPTEIFMMATRLQKEIAPNETYPPD